MGIGLVIVAKAEARLRLERCNSGNGWESRRQVRGIGRAGARFWARRGILYRRRLFVNRR